MKNFLFLLAGITIGYLLGTHQEEKVVTVIEDKVEIKTSAIKRVTNPRIEKIQRTEVKDKNSKYNYKDLNRKVEFNKLMQDIYELQKEEGNIEMIISIFEENLDKFPDNSRLLSQYSNYLISKSLNEEALPILEKCLKADPDNELCHGNMTNVAFEDQEKFSEAMSKCLTSNPDNSLCLMNKANNYLMRNNNFKAYSTFKNLEEIMKEGNSTIFASPGFIYSNIALTASLLNKTEEANKYYDLACTEGDLASCEKVNR